MKKNIAIIILSAALAVCLLYIVYLTRTPEIATDDPLFVISSIDLISNTDKYDGKIIRTGGYLEFTEERTAVYILKEYCDEGVYKNAVWLDVNKADEDEIAELKALNGNYVVLEGTYDKSRCGPKSAFSGGVKDIKQIEID